MGNEAAAGMKTRKKGLATTLFIWFMILALGPLVAIGLVEYREGKRSIIDDRYQQLSSINVLLSQQLNDFFDSIVTNLFVRVWTAQELLDELVVSYDKQSVSNKLFIGSPDYKKIVDKHSAEFTDFIQLYAYSDVMIGDARGNILYTATKQDDLGENLFDGSLARTYLAKSVKEGLLDHKPRYTPLEYYPLGEGQLVSFFIMPLINEREVVTGFIAVKIFASHIQELFSRQSDNLGKDVNSYLVGVDGHIAFGTAYSPDLKLKLENNHPLLTLWLSHFDSKTGRYQEDSDHLKDHDTHSDDKEMGSHDHHDHDHEHDTTTDNLKDQTNLIKSDAHIRSYQNLKNENVLGIYFPVNVGGTPMALISEVSHQEAFTSIYEFRNRLLWVSSVIFVIVFILAIFITRSIVKPILRITSWVKRVASGDYVQGTILSGNTEISELSRSFTDMTEKLRTISNENEERSWMQDGLAGLNDSLRGDLSMEDLCRNVVTFLCRYLGFQTGAMYVLLEDQALHLMGTYAWRMRKQHANKFLLGDGLVGQAALEKQSIEIVDIPPDYLVIESGLGRAKPCSILIVPLVYENELKGVLEFALVRSVTDEQKRFLEHSIENTAIAINSAQYRSRVSQLLDKTTKQSEAMKEQQEELKAVNEELEKRAAILEESEEELKAQSEELKKSNAELEEKGEQLLQQKEQIEQKNRDIELSKKAIEDKAKELEQSSKYKSEFLANMSHELRTPLNSLLLLSQMLADNDEGNLTEDQVESAQVIFNGGNELLELINDILDLSKVEAGKMTINLEDVDLQELGSGISTLFKPLAENKGLDFAVTIKPGTSKMILSDSQRLMQIVKNFLSNAFKFTESGGVYVDIFPVSRQGRYAEDSFVCFAVRDTGIGIPADKQDAIFDAFRQADGSTSRKYGGTGLGLAISRELSAMLGGFIELSSKEGEGTTFSVFLPDNPVVSISQDKVYADRHHSDIVDGEIPTNSGNSETTSSAVSSEQSAAASGSLEIPEVNPDQASLLLIEDDPNFTETLGRIAEKHNFQYFHIDTGRGGLKLASAIQPDAIILDLGLPDMDGQEVLAQLKSDESTRDIPVHIISGRDPGLINNEGAVGYLLKPVSMADLDRVFVTLEDAIQSDITRVLVLDSDEQARQHIGEILTKKGIEIGQSANAQDAELKLREKYWQCLVMDCELADSSGVEFLEKIQKVLGEKMPFVIIHTARNLSEEEHTELQKYTNTMVMKGDMASNRVLDEVSLFLHSVERPAEVKEASNETVLSVEKNLEGHKILLVDDDLRNTFALSEALQGMGMEVIMADNGKVALDKLDDEGDIELVLMDIMMPIMDGYETTREIRKNNAYKSLPVIALTAKAMADDRAKCIDAGANDYMTKPVDMDKLVAMLKVWLSK